MAVESGGAAERYLIIEVAELNELARNLRSRILDVFVKSKEVEATSSEAPAPNPINYATTKTQETQYIIKECLELLELEIINKIQGGK